MIHSDQMQFDSNPQSQPQLCECGIPLKFGISGPNAKNPNRPYAACAKQRDDPTKCGVFIWPDELPPQGGGPPKKRYQKRSTYGGPYPNPNPAPSTNNAVESRQYGSTNEMAYSSNVAKTKVPQQLPAQKSPAGTADANTGGEVAILSSRCAVTLEQMLIHVQQLCILVQKISEKKEHVDTEELDDAKQQV